VFIMGRRQGALDKAKAEIGENVSMVQGDVANLGDLDKLCGEGQNDAALTLLQVLVLSSE
jgi:hypothetical protein